MPHAMYSHVRIVTMGHNDELLAHVETYHRLYNTMQHHNAAAPTNDQVTAHDK